MGRTPKELDKLMSKGVKEVLPEIEEALEMFGPDSEEARELKSWKKVFIKWQAIEEEGLEKKKPEILRKTYELSVSSIL